MTFSRLRWLKTAFISAAVLTVAGVFCTLALTLTGSAAAAGGTILGDADGDGEVTISDVTCIQRALAEWTDSSCSEKAADIDGNGKLEITDATLLQQWLAEMNVAYSIGEELEQPAETSAAVTTQSATDPDGWGREIYRP